MLRTFNCGVGFCLIAKKRILIKKKNVFINDFAPYEIGYISKNKKKSIC